MSSYTTAASDGKFCAGDCCRHAHISGIKQARFSLGNSASCSRWSLRFRKLFFHLWQNSGDFSVCLWPFCGEQRTWLILWPNPPFSLHECRSKNCQYPPDFLQRSQKQSLTFCQLVYVSCTRHINCFSCDEREKPLRCGTADGSQPCKSPVPV